MEELGTASPATDYSEPALNFELLAGGLISSHSKTLAEFQASQLSRVYALSISTASTIATLAYGVVNLLLLIRAEGAA